MPEHLWVSRERGRDTLPSEGFPVWTDGFHCGFRLQDDEESIVLAVPEPVKLLVLAKANVRQIFHPPTLDAAGRALNRSDLMEELRSEASRLFSSEAWSLLRLDDAALEWFRSAAAERTSAWEDYRRFFAGLNAVIPPQATGRHIQTWIHWVQMRQRGWMTRREVMAVLQDFCRQAEEQKVLWNKLYVGRETAAPVNSCFQPLNEKLGLPGHEELLVPAFKPAEFLGNNAGCAWLEERGFLGLLRFLLQQPECMAVVQAAALAGKF